MTNTLTYVELLTDAKNKEVYEIVDSPLRHVIGNKYVVKKSQFDSNIIKKEGTYDSNFSEDVLLPTGGIVVSKFRRVFQWVDATVQEAIDAAMNGEDVKVIQNNGISHIFGRYTSLKDVGIDDLDDLHRYTFKVNK
jgi:hypothetical protein